jgi:hypothetical protein
MRWEARAALALVLAAGLLAGCLGGETDPDASDEPAEPASAEDPQPEAAAGEDTDAGEGAPPGAPTPVRFDLEGFTNTTTWANGTYQPQEACVPVGCTTGDAFRTVELDDQLAEGAPTQVRAELTYDEGANPVLDPMSLGIYSASGYFYEFDYTDETGSTVVEVTFLADEDPLVLQVFYNGPAGPSTEAEYDLRIDTAADPTTVLPGMPVAVSAEPGQTVTLTSTTGDGEPAVLAYGPDDAFRGRLTGQRGELEATVPGNASAGEHVLVPTSASPPLELATTASQPTMRALNYEYETGEARPVEGAEPVEWSFEPDPLPLAVGGFLTDEAPLGASLDSGALEVVGPEGSLLSTDLGCGTCLTSGYTEYRWSAIGAEGLAPGAHEATYEPTGEAGYAVGELYVRYAR